MDMNSGVGDPQREWRVTGVKPRSGAPFGIKWDSSGPDPFSTAKFTCPITGPTPEPSQYPVEI